MSGRVRLEAADAVLELAPEHGGRLTRWTVGARDLLLQPSAGDPPTLGGCYAMVPWAGRIRDAAFAWAGRRIELEAGDPPHALHGVGFHRRWEVEELTGDATRLRLDLASADVVSSGWPLGGLARQRVHLQPLGVELHLELTATDRPMPVSLGWHPWFVRHLDGVEAVVHVPHAGSYERAGMLPTGRIVPTSARPWDDCLVAVPGVAPEVRWPGVGAVAVVADAPVFVVFEQHPAGVCVEPQTAPPDAVHHGWATHLQPGETLALATVLRWLPQR